MSDGNELQQQEDIEKLEKISYKMLDEFDTHFNFYLNSGKTFTVEATSYTKKIKVGGKSIIFNQDGNSDFVVLALINKVRNDAKKWFKSNALPKFNEQDIFWSRLTERPPNTVITKVDINSAYWQCAMRKGIITDHTNQYLVDKYERTKKQKEARLKAFGSLATKKIITQYTNGEEIDSIIQAQPSRQLYMFICQCIDDVMSEICVTTPGAFFYYWDCIFTGNESTEEVINFIKKTGYSSKTEETVQSIMQIGNHKYIMTTEPEKVYLNRKLEDPKAEPEEPKYYPIKPVDLFFLGTKTKILRK